MLLFLTLFKYYICQYFITTFAENTTLFFNAEKLQFYSNETVKLMCNGAIDFPTFTQISITKANVILIANKKNSIQVIANGSKSRHYGEYFCIMDANGVQFTKTIFLRNKGKAYCIAVRLRFRYSGQKLANFKNRIFKGFYSFGVVFNDHNYITLLYMHINFYFQISESVKVFFLQY